MTTLKIHQFPCLSDNYGVLIHDPDSGQTAAIDAPETVAVEKALADTGWNLTHILVTHHHADHTDGVLPLKEKYGATVVGHKNDANRIPGIDVEVSEGETFDFAGHGAKIIETSGHTIGHIAYYFAENKLAFVGDTLFALGCGRVFEGTMDQMVQSLEKLKVMAPDTTIYCGHEYTLANAKFSLSVDPENTKLKARVKEIEALRAKNQPTLPTTMSIELATNPFLRSDDPAIRKHLGMSDASDSEVFAEIRRRKDKF